MVHVSTIAAGDTFSYEGQAYTAVEDSKQDKHSVTPGRYKVLVTTATEEEPFYLLLGSSFVEL